MSRLVLVAVLAVVLCVVGLGGCRDGERAALPAGPAVSASPGPTSVTARSGSGAAAASPGSAGDPLAGIESDVDAVERDLDADAGSAPAR